MPDKGMDSPAVISMDQHNSDSGAAAMTYALT